MREVVAVTVADVIPEPAQVLGRLGFPAGAVPNGRVAALLDRAFDLLERDAAPVGLTAEVTIEAFAAIYHGEGHNELETPLGVVFPPADDLSLFAVTVGEPVSARIAGLFETREFALASLLDAAASEASERAGDVVERVFRERLLGRGRVRPSTRTLRYSPGYCGWHMTGQRALFAALGPETIGITLCESCLMQPLKSMSGVIVAGPAEIHEFGECYPFCAQCVAPTCRERIRRVLEG